MFISLAISFDQRMPVLALLKEELRLVGPAFAIQAFLAALAAALWATDPRLLVLMAGPLFTVTLYQRSSLASRRATRDAHTDSLTRVGNNRAYELGLATALDAAAGNGSTLSLCLVDVDDFKQINDRFGHPLGDQVLVEIARLLDPGKECIGTFRFGGDEFAVVLAGDEAKARAHVEGLYERVAAARFCHDGAATISVGIATFPDHATSVEGLERRPTALSTGRSCTARTAPASTAPLSPRRAVPWSSRVGSELQARLRAAENLVRVVDVKDEYAGEHSERVARLVEAIAHKLALDAELVEQLKLAGRLHDLGKVAIPDSVLQKPGPLAPHEARQLAHHPELGASLLDGMDIRPVDVWIRHHHEHWDGSGYPDGLAGEEIPFGSRVILVADAFDAITSDRSYRAASDAATALVEIRLHSGIQFDPTVVEALEAYVEEAGLVEAAHVAEAADMRQLVA